MKKTTTFTNIVLRNIILALDAQEDENGRLVGLKVGFKPINDVIIYHKSTGQPIPFLRRKLGINLDIGSLIELNSLFLETQSSYLFNIRSKVFDKDLLEVIESKHDEKTSIRVRVSRMFFREEEKGRFKISIAVLDKNDETGEIEEIVNINFTKRDVFIFSSLIRKITASYHRGSSIQANIEDVQKETGEIIDSKICSVSKIDNSLLIDNVWLHGQELLNVMHAVEHLSFKLGIEKNLNSINSIYRQIKVTNENEIAYFQLRKFDRAHQEESLFDENGELYEIRIPISSLLLSYLHLFLDINVLRHADYTTDQNVEILGTSKALEDRKIRFHIGMKESTLGVGVKDKTKDSAALGSKISLIGKTKEGKYSIINEEDDVLENYIKVFNKEGESRIVPVLTYFDIDLKDQYVKLASALASALTREYVTEEKTWNLFRFYVINQNNEGKFKYSFSVLADSKNKAPAVLIIDKYKLKKGEDELHMGRYRQPLFEKYAYQLLAIILTASEDIETLDLLEDRDIKDILKYQYRSLKKIDETKKERKIEYGIKKRSNSVEIGNFSQKQVTSLLSYQDAELLNISAYSRLTTGNWIPFVGDKVAIGQDGYLTDMYGEINMEENLRGASWATKNILCHFFLKERIMTLTDSLRLEIFRKQIKEQHLLYLEELGSEELLKLLDSTIIANSPDSKSVRYGFLFHLLFCRTKEKKERLFNQIERLKKLEENLTKTEKVVIKFGIIHGFSSPNYRVELYRYIKAPISFNTGGSGRKIISSVRFKQMFSFAYNLTKRGKKNDNFPKY